MQNPLKFMCVIAAVLLSTLSVAQDARPIPTRFGPLAYDSERALMFRGKRVSPRLAYDPYAIASPIAKFNLQDSDAILFQQSKGNSCPGNFVYVTVSVQGAKVTSNFGTCYDENIEPIQEGQSISFSMPNAGGKGNTTFVYRGGIVSKNGQAVR